MQSIPNQDLDRKNNSPDGEIPAINLLGVRILDLPSETLIKMIIEQVNSSKKSNVVYINVHSLNLSYEHVWFKQWLNAAEIGYCDGFGVMLAARLMGFRLKYRSTPPDWVHQLASACETHTCSLFLLGGKPNVAEKAANMLLKTHPNLSIAGTHHGYFDKSTNTDANRDVIDKINLAHPDILMVGFGMPLQEQWLIANRDRLKAKVYLPVGALFDYLAGGMPRPPKFMTDHGFEWFGRLMIEPTRLWRRYLFEMPIFYVRILRSRTYHSAE